jgi:hypothetical protein
MLTKARVYLNIDKSYGLVQHVWYCILMIYMIDKQFCVVFLLFIMLLLYNPYETAALSVVLSGYSGFFHH